MCVRVFVCVLLCNVMFIYMMHCVIFVETKTVLSLTFLSMDFRTEKKQSHCEDFLCLNVTAVFVFLYLPLAV